MYEDGANVEDAGQVQDTGVQAEVAEEAEAVAQQDSTESTALEQNEQNDDAEYDSVVPKPAAEQQVQASEDGSIDPNEFKESIKREMREEANFERQERRAWERLEEKYPEVKEDKDLRELILASRVMDVQNGGQGSLINAGNKVMAKFASARSDGKADAQVNIRTQRTAGASRATAPRVTDSSDAMDKIRSGDQAAMQDVLASWIDQGKL